MISAIRWLSTVRWNGGYLAASVLNGADSCWSRVLKARASMPQPQAGVTQDGQALLHWQNASENLNINVRPDASVVIAYHNSTTNAAATWAWDLTSPVPAAVLAYLNLM